MRASSSHLQTKASIGKRIEAFVFSLTCWIVLADGRKAPVRFIGEMAELVYCTRLESGRSPKGDPWVRILLSPPVK